MDRLSSCSQWSAEQRNGNDRGRNPVEPHVQHMEIDNQAHGGGDLTNAAIIIRIVDQKEQK